jgi:uncharacterized membrane protein required for colicin V production
MKLGEFAYSWFDLLVVVVLAIGVWRGRTRGMSEELLDLLKWLAILTVGGMVYSPAGRFLDSYTHLGLGVAYVAVYLGVIIVMRLCFGWIKHLVGEKLVGGDAFGGAEYYLGMLAGAVRFGCYVVVAMAFLNAHYVSPEQVAADARMQQENFGDISFPTIGRMQHTVFDGSASGQLVKKYLAHELIVSTPSERSAATIETLRSQRERAVYEALGERK